MQPSESGSKTQLLDPVESSPAASTQATSKPSWADLLKGSSRKMSKKGESFYLDSGEQCVKIPNEVITRNQKRWESFIIGQFHGNLPSPGALHAIFNGIWSNRKRDITVSKLGPRTILIRIPDPSTCQRVLNQGMWHIEGQTMFVATWEPGLNPSLPELTEAPVWLEFRGVPPHFFSEEGFEHIAGMLGQPVHCHQSTINMTNLEVEKVLTIINPSVPLPEAVNVQFATGEIHRVAVSSPWLPPTCSYCKEMGHSIRRCPLAPITCIPCNSSAHSSEGCSRAKTKSPKDQSGKKPTPIKRTNLKKRTQAPQLKRVEKQTQSEEESPKRAKHGKSQICSSDEEATCKQKMNIGNSFIPSTKEARATTSQSGKAKESVSSLSESSSSSDYPDTSESSSIEEEEMIVEEEEIPFTKVLSKKERRHLKNSTGKSPNSKNL